MANGGFLFVAGALALGLKALSDKRKKDSFIGPQVGQGVTAAGTRGVSLAVANKAITTAPQSSSIAVSGSAIRNVIATVAIVGAVLKGMEAVLSTLIEVALGNPYVWIAVIVLIVVMGIIFFQSSADNAHRVNDAIQGLSGSRFMLNRWEFQTAKAWLDNLKVGYTVVQVKDDFVEGHWYDTENRKIFRKTADRYALTNISGMDPADWLQLQLFIRCAAIDYFRRVSPYLTRIYQTWKLDPMAADQQPPYPPLPVGGYFKTFADMPDVQARVRGWQEAWATPMIGDATPFDASTIDPKTGYTAIPLDPLDALKYLPACRTGLTYAATYEQAAAQFAGSPAWSQVQINNHFTAITAALAPLKLDPREKKSEAKVAWGWHMYAGAGLTPADDGVIFEAATGMLKFQKEYWGWAMSIDPIWFLLNKDGALQVVNKQGDIVMFSYNTPMS